MQRESSQRLTFVAGSGDLSDIAIVWADASQKNRPDGSSTLGYVIGLADSSILSGEECHVSLLSWRSAKTPRQVLGSNGAEVQAVTETEDAVFRTRGLLVEIMGIPFDRKNLGYVICKHTKGAVVMDTRGIYDAASRNISSLHGLRSSRAGYELTLSVAQAVRSGTRFRWVHGGVQLGDSLTKTGARKVLLQFLANGQRWKIVHDPKFESGRKVRKRELEKQIRETEISFVRQIADMAIKSRWPFDHDDQSLRMWGDAITETPRYHEDTTWDFVHAPQRWDRVICSKKVVAALSWPLCIHRVLVIPLLGSCHLYNPKYPDTSKLWLFWITPKDPCWPYRFKQTLTHWSGSHLILMEDVFLGCQNWDPKKKKKTLQKFTVRPYTRAGWQNGFVPFWTQDSEQRDWQPKEIYEDFAAQHLWRMSQNRMWWRDMVNLRSKKYDTPWETTNGWNLRKALLGKGKTFTNPPIFRVPLLDVSNSRFFLRIC